MSTPFSTCIVKVVSPCNLNCTYCYEYNRGDETWRNRPVRISKDVVEKLAERINEHSELHAIKQFNINAHGGEPFLLTANGLEMFYSTLLGKINPQIKLNFGLQTNATLATEKIIDVLNKYKVSVGVSMDGYDKANEFRINHKGEDSFEAIHKGALLIKEKAKYFSGFLCVINVNSDPVKVLDYFKSFNPPTLDLLQPFGNWDNLPHNDTVGKLGDWLSRAFHHYVTESGFEKIKIRILDDALKTVLGGKPSVDWFGNIEPDYFIVTTDGNYEGLDTLKVVGTIGRELNLSVSDTSIEQIRQSDFIAMRSLGMEQTANECQDCHIFKWCGGGYLPTRFSKENNFKNTSIYCEDLKLLFRNVALWCNENTEVNKNFISQTLLKY
jgi:uncharacterized protein